MSDTYQTLDMPDANVIFYPVFFDETQSKHYFDSLRETIQWEQKEMQMFGKAIKLPRLIAWYGDEGSTYTYSGITHQPHAWTPELLAIKSQVEKITEAQFNSVLLNLYRNENDSVGWHSDDEPELGQNPVIASISFGDVRKFQFRNKDDYSLRQSVDLLSGSLLLMAGATQHHWHHRIPKSKQPKSERMNLTFRVID